MNRQYSVQPTMFISRLAHSQVSTYAPDEKLVEAFHKLLDMVPDDNHALMIDHVVSQLLRTHVRPDGMFEPELLPTPPITPNRNKD